jgi:sau1hsdS1
MEKPKIRFRKFNNKWKKNKLDKVVDFFDNQRIPIDSSERKSGPYPYYGASGIIDYVDDFIFSGEYVLLAEDGANIILRSSPIAYLSKGKFWLNNHAHIMRMKTGSNEFLIQLLEKQNYEKYNTGTAQPKLNGEVVKNITLHFPSDDEQFAIGTLFCTLDDLLASYKDNLANYQSLKATMLSKMFPKAGQTVPEIRLDGFEGEWVEKRLKDISKRVTRKNNDLVSERALTISAQFGLIDQEEFFQKKIASKDVSGYYLIKKGEFAYNKSYSTGYPLGAIKRLDKYENGVLSTLYILFKAVDVDSDYLAHYYESDKWHQEVSMCAAEGARNHGLLNIAPADFFNTRLVVPKELEEQRAIGSYFSNLDNLINSHQEKISQLENLKKKLLQDMFI